ncbi:hypothetical protein BT96DRAFT_1019104 [Gymnopus androsaceus JB14]|uniref:Uncharacterized protein n=1 Tax=Gymnopus androsaceus JB14 TaxID=1447944 RepID=A0A6A4HQR0_9AGAR|nr:hypothetical protein BT96DRAFT_1019104 [Gymnopus androsaceus JB14]
MCLLPLDEPRFPFPASMIAVDDAESRRRLRRTPVDLCSYDECCAHRYFADEEELEDLAAAVYDERRCPVSETEDDPPPTTMNADLFVPIPAEDFPPRFSLSEGALSLRGSHGTREGVLDLILPSAVARHGFQLEITIYCI